MGLCILTEETSHPSATQDLAPGDAVLYPFGGIFYYLSYNASPIPAGLTATQISTLDSALQPLDNISQLNNDEDFQNATQVATAISDAVNNLIDGAPVAYDTLIELANEIQNNDSDIVTILSQLSNHIADTNNPHSVTKAQVGLSDVPNVNATLRSNHTGSQLASTISNFSTAVRLVVLSGLSFSVDSAIVATDTILQAFGKLQAQINNILNLLYKDFEIRTTGLINQTLTPQPYIDRDFNIPVNADYRIRVSGLWSINATDTDFVAELVVDGGTPITIIRKEAKDSAGAGPTFATTAGGTAATGTNQLNPLFFEDVFSLNSGSRNVTVNFFQGEFGNDEAAFHRCTVIIERA